MKRLPVLGVILLVAVATAALPHYSHSGARIFIPFPGGHVLVNPDGSGGVRFPGGSVSWPGGPKAPPVPHRQKTNELERLETERNRLEADIETLDKLLAQRPEGEERNQLLRERRELERKLSQVVLRLERLR